ncbi:thioester reductase domain-containing protein [Pseudoalteromonas sp. MMG013]|uniref:thioester reductase domain-containing protein n=1 Tax=Pseudoalteromonas sp. MMG013 TaxID=2822687 RepID=UPI001B3596B0|nr:thioester reductase domain-containing protein [Pseudoalteromonas sp. MMG013]MBQ4861092.1 thioester reductase domain-containing protein [Pseudoalteromonas sp. MMG013]
MTPAFLSPEKNRVFITGVTGYLGAHLVAELLALPWVKLTCFVRAPSQQAGLARLRTSMTEFGIWEAGFSDRVTIIIGDLGKPKLGLNTTQYAQLLNDVDVVLHNGAAVNYVLTYAQLKNTNVNGTQEILKLAQEQDIAFVNVSTLRLFDARSDGQPIRETDAVDEKSTSYSGYSRSKWISEKLVAAAGKRGMPYFVVRPGLICAGKGYNSPNINDALAKLVTGCIQLGAAPQSQFQFNLTSLDYVVKGLVELMLASDTNGKTFHLVNDTPTLCSRILETARTLGYPVEMCGYLQWVAKLKAIASTSDNALLPLLDYFEDDLPQKSQGRVFDSSLTQSFISDRPVEDAQIDDAALMRVIEGFSQFQLFHKPA